MNEVLNTPAKRGLVTLVGLLSVGVFTTWLLVFVLFPVTKKEIMQKQSPTGKFKAVVEQTKSGQASTFGYYVYVEQKSIMTSRPLAASFYGARRNEHDDGVNLEWIEPNKLRIEYFSAEAAAPKTAVQCGADTIQIECVKSH